MKKSFVKLGSYLGLVLLLSACALPGMSQSQPGAVATLSAQLIARGRATSTAQAALTQGAVTVATYQPEMTATQLPPAATITLRPTQTLAPSSTPLPSFTPIPPSATPVPIPCDMAEFVSDVNFPDGTEVMPGQTFTKIWRIKNSGSCTWTTGYSLAFYSGEQMGAESPQALSATVPPGETIDVSMTLKAPSTAGRYRSAWKLRNTSGIDFGIGPTAGTIYVVVQVEESSTDYAFDFVNAYCGADWSSGAGSLPCPGTDGDADGFVLRAAHLVLETGTQDDEPGLITQPQAITDGIIRGKYPAYKVQDGDTFKALVMCAETAENCDVKLQLDYQIGSDAIQTLASWYETNDGTYHSVSVDLSSLVGEKVRFILTVQANGAMNQDRAEWLAPRIVHNH